MNFKVTKLFLTIDLNFLNNKIISVENIIENIPLNHNLWENNPPEKFSQREFFHKNVSQQFGLNFTVSTKKGLGCVNAETNTNGKL